MVGLRDWACWSKLARGGTASACTTVGATMVIFVRPRPTILLTLSVSMGPKGAITMPPIGPSNFLMSAAERSVLNFAGSMLRLSKGSISRTLLAAWEDAFFMGFFLSMIGISF